MKSRLTATRFTPRRTLHRRSRSVTFTFSFADGEPPRSRPPQPDVAAITDRPSRRTGRRDGETAKIVHLDREDVDGTARFMSHARCMARCAGPPRFTPRPMLIFSATTHLCLGNDGANRIAAGDRGIFRRGDDRSAHSRGAIADSCGIWLTVCPSVLEIAGDRLPHDRARAALAKSACHFRFATARLSITRVMTISRPGGGRARRVAEESFRSRCAVTMPDR